MRLIDADALMDDAMKRYCKDCDKRRGIKSGKWRIIYEIGDAPCRACSVDDMKAELEDAPTIEERKKGKWIESGINYQCPFCHEEYDDITNWSGKRWKLCPMCGARLGEDDDIS